MITFNEKAVCDKCGFKSISVRYHKNKFDCLPNHWDFEHIHRICNRCGYEWPEEVLNKESNAD